MGRRPRPRQPGPLRLDEELRQGLRGEHGRARQVHQHAADGGRHEQHPRRLGQENMAYWGFSYGSLLGQTYAALYPERSSRVIIDGVVDVFEWYESPLLTSDFTDSQRVLDGFFDECVKAGPRCALSPWRSRGRSFRKGDWVSGNPQRRARRRLSQHDDLRRVELSHHVVNAVFRAHVLPQRLGPAGRPTRQHDERQRDGRLPGVRLRRRLRGHHRSRRTLSRPTTASPAPTLGPGRQSLTDTLFPLYKESTFAYARNRVTMPGSNGPSPRRTASCRVTAPRPHIHC